MALYMRFYISSHLVWWDTSEWSPNSYRPGRYAFLHVKWSCKYKCCTIDRSDPGTPETPLSQSPDRTPVTSYSSIGRRRILGHCNTPQHHLFIWLAVYISTFLSVYLSIYLSSYQSINSIYLSTCISFSPSVGLCVCRSTCLSACLSVVLSV
jgi:hypothetical protein